MNIKALESIRQQRNLTSKAKSRKSEPKMFSNRRFGNINAEYPGWIERSGQNFAGLSRLAPPHPAL